MQTEAILAHQGTPRCRWNLCVTDFCVFCRVTENKLREHFHLPLTEVAKKFGMCNTAFKKLCRKQGIMQWPYRTLRSLEKKMASLRAEQKFTYDNIQIEEQISKLQAKREQILSGSGTNISQDDDPVVQPSPSDDSSTRQVYNKNTIFAPRIITPKHGCALFLSGLRNFPENEKGQARGCFASRRCCVMQTYDQPILCAKYVKSFLASFGFPGGLSSKLNPMHMHTHTHTQRSTVDLAYVYQHLGYRQKLYHMITQM
jgi:hypothetical protein